MDTEWTKIRKLVAREGEFDDFWITGRLYERVDDGEQGWDIESKPSDADGPYHCFWVGGEVFRSIRHAENKLIIGDETAIHGAEAGAILRAIRKWEYEWVP